MADKIRLCRSPWHGDVDRFYRAQKKQYIYMNFGLEKILACPFCIEMAGLEQRATILLKPMPQLPVKESQHVTGCQCVACLGGPKRFNSWGYE